MSKIPLNSSYVESALMVTDRPNSWGLHRRCHRNIFSPNTMLSFLILLCPVLVLFSLGEKNFLTDRAAGWKLDFDLQRFIKNIGKSYLPRELLTCDGTLVRMLLKKLVLLNVWVSSSSSYNMIMNANGSQKSFKIKMDSVDSNHLLALSCGAVYISLSVWILQQFSNQFFEQF